MVHDFKPSLFKDIPSRKLHLAKTRQWPRPANEKPMETEEINTKASSKTI